MDSGALTPSVLYEDKNILVLSKPSGLLVHGIFDKNGPKHTEETLVDWLAKKYPETTEVGDRDEDNLIRQQRGGIVHRLDRYTSGVMVVARNQKTFEELKKLFAGRSVKKTYITLVWGRVHEKKGVIDKPISIKDGSVKRTVFKGKMPREAVTEYETIGHYKKDKDEFTLLRVMPKTGRTHQIRVHLSAIGHEVYGDKLYGKRRDHLELGRQFLHASILEFKIPGGKAHTFESPLPEELSELLAKLQLAE
jgi:23S rRNA pseudouridine1911/1915/1917 synthase